MKPISKIFSALLLPALLLTGAGCGTGSAQQAAQTPVTLTIWNVFESAQPYQQIFDNYRTLHPNVSINYRSLRSEEYETELLRAFAEGRAPDIFAIHNSAIPTFDALIDRMPGSVQIPFQETQGTIKKSTVYTMQTVAMPSLKTFKDSFVDVVQNDVLKNERQANGTDAQRVLGLPFSVDSLALFYNKDLFNASGIATPPADWDAFQQAVAKITVTGTNDLIVQSAAALGTADNIDRSGDIAALLMMQNGTQMVTPQGRAQFSTTNSDTRLLTAAQALSFYTNFANPAVKNYTWNKDQQNSFDAFVNGKTAMILGYAYNIPSIRARNPKLRFGVSPMPQIAGATPVNYANYWVYSVAKNSAHKDWAWDFLRFATTQPDQAKLYLDAAQKPPALRALRSQYLEHETLGVFADQILTAKSWYHGKNDAAVDEALKQLIRDFSVPMEDPSVPLRRAENTINQTL